ncbi:MAG: glycogen synthase GlgA [candidate division KSB1 bacterium]|nr:glycogen synthase GlgA [candidate division KSB1 bacterium]
MRIGFATSECVPFVKTGGLADVSGALPKFLTQNGCEVKVFLPLYGSIKVLDHGLILVQELQNIPVQIGDKTVTFNVWYKRAEESGVEYYLIDCPLYYHRAQIYTSDPDEDERFILLQHAVFLILQKYHWAPEVIHCNDWQTALIPVYLKEKYHWDRLFAHTATVLSIHNLAYQGRFAKDSVGAAGLSYDKYYPGGPFEFHDSFSFLKAGILYAEIISTVSETYAQEIQTPAYGVGMEGVLALRRNDLFGILNGIDTEQWNPAADKFIPYRYQNGEWSNKLKNKRALLDYFKLPFAENIPTIGMITRLTVQKGLELLGPIFDELMKLPLQMVVLGDGEKKYEDFLRWAVQTYPEKIGAYVGFNNELAHLITAGSDMFLMPSRYEPCGLNQMYSLNYGTVPIVRKTGGLADTVKDYHEWNGQGNGFSFYDFTPYAMYTAIGRALELFQQKDIWQEIMKRGMAEDFSWQASARKYIELYKRAKSKRAG